VGFDEGTIMIIGANVGATHTDPAWRGFMDPLKSNLLKVFVEPIPNLFYDLQNNVRLSGITNSLLINAALTNVTAPFSMFCLQQLSQTLRRKFPSFITELCSLDRNRFFSSYGILLRQFSREEIEQHIEKVVVKGLTFGDLMKTYNLKNEDIRSIQIDVEGFDDQVQYESLTMNKYMHLIRLLLLYHLDCVSAAAERKVSSFQTPINYIRVCSSRPRAPVDSVESLEASEL
jgi:hypothetical protein